MPQQKAPINLMAWFGNSAVVTDAGLPRVVYHGTRYDFSVFDGLETVGWFCSDVTLANKSYAHEESDDAGPNIVPVYLSIQRPLSLVGRFDMNDQLSGEDAVELVPELDLSYLYRKLDLFKGDDQAWLLVNNIDFMSAVVKAGYDGIQVNESGFETWAVVCPRQVKSAIGNCGQFDPHHPDITH